MPDDASRVTKSGFDGYITKPFRVIELTTALRGFVAKFVASHAKSVSTDDPDKTEPKKPRQMTETVHSTAMNGKPSTDQTMKA